MENSGKALAAYLKPRENAEPRDNPPNEFAELIKTFSLVAEYWLSDQTRAAELQAKLGKAYLDLWGNAARRLAGEDAKPADRAGAARQTFRRSGMAIEPVLRFSDAGISADDQMGERAGARCRGHRSAYPQEGRVLCHADHQRDRAVEFRADQSGSAARNASPRTPTISCAA